MMTAAFAETYVQVLAGYIRTHSEDALYRASLLSQTFVEHAIGPEEIIGLHFEQLDKVMENMSYREQARSIGDAHQFLLEIMITYGVQYREYLELRMREGLREAEVRAETERRRALEQERLEKERANLLDQIAHELRTPLTAALGSLDLLQRRIMRGNIDGVHPLIIATREALDRLSRLTASLVQASRGERLQLEHLPQQLDTLVTQACGWVEPMATAKDIHFHYECDDVDMQVVGDEDALLSIFGNLLSNAIRYTPTGGSVTVRSGTEGDTAWVEVRDTGIGMSQEIQNHIFERFYRAPEARTLDAQGLGLGLSLVKEFVEEHSGSLTFTSACGQGSTFRVTLPLADVTGAGITPVGEKGKEGERHEATTGSGSDGPSDQCDQPATPDDR